MRKPGKGLGTTQLTPAYLTNLKLLSSLLFLFLLYAY